MVAGVNPRHTLCRHAPEWWPGMARNAGRHAPESVAGMARNPQPAMTKGRRKNNLSEYVEMYHR